MPQTPTYEQTIEYYLREDVSTFLWQLSQTRQLKFFHHCNSDIRLTREPPKAIRFHCEPDIGEFRRRIGKSASDIPSYPYDFFPFWGMQSTKVNVPGLPNELVGWDVRFEFDFDRNQSFAVVLPMAGALEHFKVPFLIKFSGHRSLHLVIPAESFPIEMKEHPDHKKWMDVFESLGDFFCRIAPYVNPTSIGLSKETILTTPYSLHRYNGLVSLPLSVEDALSFDDQRARIENVLRVNTVFPEHNCDGLEMKTFLTFVKNVKNNPSTLVEAAQDFYTGPLWETFFGKISTRDFEDSPTSAILMAGICELRRHSGSVEEANRERTERALLVIDNPATKSFKQLGMVGEFGFHVPFDTIVRQRKVNAAILDCWVHGGIDHALERILSVISDDSFKCPFLLGLRLCTIIPENREVIAFKLLTRLEHSPNQIDMASLFYTLAASQFAVDAIRASSELEDSKAKLLTDILRSPTIWHVDSDPIKALATLSLSYGPETVCSWSNNPEGAEGQLVIKNAFGGNVKKFQYQLRDLLKKVDNH
jgi:hypothetical protein